MLKTNDAVKESIQCTSTKQMHTLFFILNKNKNKVTPLIVNLSAFVNYNTCGEWSCLG
jgi:hypothetical protein